MIHNVHHLNCGSAKPVGTSWIDAAFTETVCHCLVLECSRSLVMVDCGICRKFRAHPQEMGLLSQLMRYCDDENEAAWHQLPKLGFNPKDVRHIVTTHWDIDHASGLIDFPWATVHVSQREMHAGMSPSSSWARHRYSFLKSNLPNHLQTYELDSREEWFGFKGLQVLEDIDEDIGLIPLYGHSAGHMGVTFRDSHNCQWLFAGDAYFLRQALLGEVKSHILRMFETWTAADCRAYDEVQMQLRQLITTHPEVAVISAHDRGEWQQTHSDRIRTKYP